jgi:hypothetical protein
MSANLITGNLFSPILASQDSDYQAGVSGDKTLILPVGAKMSLEIEDANTIRANDGVLVTKEGRRVQIDTGAVEEWSIPTGTQGETSYYLIGFHLYTTGESAEICETFIEKVASATDTITEDTFKGGATEVYITLGRVTQDGINLDSVEGLIDTADSLTDLGAKITQINADLSALKLNIGTAFTVSPSTSYTMDTDAIITASSYFGTSTTAEVYLNGTWLGYTQSGVEAFSPTFVAKKGDVLTFSGSASWRSLIIAPISVTIG